MKGKKLIKCVAAALAVIITAALLTVLTTPYDRTYMAENTSDSKKQIALTFDDGPGEFTPELLDGLRERGVKASFFLMGSKVEKRPEMVKTMYEDGHLVGCHTYSHINFFKSTSDEISEEISRTNALIEEITGEKPLFFRPPYGYYTGLQLNRIDRIAVLWSCCPRDWAHQDSDYVRDYLVSHVSDGDIVLLHDTKETTVPAVLEAIDILLDEGYEFVRADELLCRNGDLLAPGLAYRYCPYDGRAWYI